MWRELGAKLMLRSPHANEDLIPLIRAQLRSGRRATPHAGPLAPRQNENSRGRVAHTMRALESGVGVTSPPQPVRARRHLLQSCRYHFASSCEFPGVSCGGAEGG